MKKQGDSRMGGVSSTEMDFQQRDKSNNQRESNRDTYVNMDECESSPSAWIYKGGRKLHELCRPFMGGNAPIKREDSTKPIFDGSVASWRKMAAKAILSNEHNSDGEYDRKSDNNNQHDDPLHPLYRVDGKEAGSLKGGYHGGQRLVPDEPRIVAPNVSKLSPRSVVEIRLQSATECVAILCSVDVLKMRSVFFYEVLNEQEDNRISSRDANDIWRDPLVIPESSPFEAAAFLESLHEGRSLFKGDWVYCWARLRYARTT